MGLYVHPGHLDIVAGIFRAAGRDVQVTVNREGPASRVLVNAAGDQHGSICAFTLLYLEPETCWSQDVWLIDTLRNRGIGTKLLTAREWIARDNHMRAISAAVRQDNAAEIKLLQRANWARCHSDDQYAWYTKKFKQERPIL